MIGLEFIILTILLVLNLILMIMKDKSLVYISFILAIFTWVISGIYIINLEFVMGIETMYALFVVVLSVLLIFEKGQEKW